MREGKSAEFEVVVINMPRGGMSAVLSAEELLGATIRKGRRWVSGGIVR